MEKNDGLIVSLPANQAAAAFVALAQGRPLEVYGGQGGRGGHEGRNGRGRGGQGSGRGGQGRGAQGRGGRGRATRGGRVTKEGRNGGHGQSTQDYLPQWRGMQLVGDSMMSRVAVNLLRAKTTYNFKLKAKQVGLIVHGQTVGQLLRLLKSDQSPRVANKVLITIGTNNILKNVPTQETWQAMQNVLQHFAEKNIEVVLTTIPPIPKVTNYQSLTDVNEKILALPASPNLKVVNLCHLTSSEFFDRDQVHFNRSGVEAFTAAVMSVLQPSTTEQEMTS